MTTASTPAPRPVAAARRGSALILVLAFTVGMAVLLLSAFYMASNATLLTKSYDREQDFKYAAEAGLAIGKSRLNNDAYALPDSAYTTLVEDERVYGADGKAIPGLYVNVYVGPSGSTTGQFGTFASVVAEARDVRGARFVRRLELTQESFAKFAYWSNRELNSTGGVIYFGSGDQIWGPVWSNDQIHVSSTGGATFHDDVGSAATSIDGVSYGVFKKGYKVKQARIELPTPRQLDRLPGFASSGSLSFTAPTNQDETTVRMRIEFVALDLSSPVDNDSTDADEGYLRVYTASANQQAWLRGDYRSENCGDWHKINIAGRTEFKFYPHSVHDDTSFTNRWTENNARRSEHRGATLAQVMMPTPNSSSSGWARWGEVNAPAPRCFLGGAPQLVAAERPANQWPGGNRAMKRGGDDTTFTRVGTYGSWALWQGTAYAPLQARAALASTDPRRRNAEELNTLLPLWRGANSGTKGVVYVAGTAGLSGTIRGRVTLYSSGTLVVLDDIRYATDPGGANGRAACPDILGLLAVKNVTVADNGLNSPPTATSRNADDTKDLYLHSVVMAMGQSFGVQNYDAGATNVNDCEGSSNGRGCLYLTGGLIQERRGAVGTSSGSGFVKRYSYDRCAAVRPPPYFPTTGRFLDNRYYELDPVKFDPTGLYKRITPGL